MILLVDDSHGIGVVRANSTSIDLSIFDDSAIEVVVIASLAKGLGTDAGMILSSNKWIARFRKSPFLLAPPRFSRFDVCFYTFARYLHVRI